MFSSGSAQQQKLMQMLIAEFAAIIGPLPNNYRERELSRPLQYQRRF